MSNSRLYSHYLKEGVSFLRSRFSYSNSMQVPKLVKIVVSSSIKDGHDAEVVSSELKLITGQQPVVTNAKKSIAGFKLRQGMPIGCVVTLRRHMMYNFLDRFVNIALPRVRDFRGLISKQFDGRGNFAFGLKEQLVFPEINYDKVDKIRGMNLVIVTTAKTDAEGKALLEFFNMPFIK